MWYLSGLIIAFFIVALMYYFEIEEADHMTLSELLEVMATALLGPLMIAVGVWVIGAYLNKHKGDLIVWKSKRYRTKEVLGLNKQKGK